MRFKVPFVALNRQFDRYSKEITNAFIDCANSGQYVLGKKVEMFEAKLASICGTKYCVTVGNGTDALLISLKLLKVNNNISGTKPNPPINSDWLIEQGWN